MTRPAGGKPHYRLSCHFKYWAGLRFMKWQVHMVNGYGLGWHRLGDECDSSAEAIRRAPR